MNSLYDCVVIGSGPAGATAALYAARASLSVLLIEQGMPGGQIATSDTVDNYPGIPRTTGVELGEAMRAHAEEAGAEMAYAMVVSVTQQDDHSFAIELDNQTVHATTLIMATGAMPRTAGFEGEDTFRGRGVSYCATCDGMFYRGKKVFVIGGGNSAVEEAVYLSRIADSVDVVVRRDQFRAPKGAVAHLLARNNVSVRYETSISQVAGDTFITDITFKNNATGETHAEHFDAGSVGVFVFAGNDPVVDLVKPYVDLADDGAVLTDEDMATKTPGLFCAGDMRSKRLRQVITAAADGAIAATAAYSYVENQSR